MPKSQTAMLLEPVEFFKCSVIKQELDALASRHLSRSVLALDAFASTAGERRGILFSQLLQTRRYSVFLFDLCFQTLPFLILKQIRRVEMRLCEVTVYQSNAPGRSSPWRDLGRVETRAILALTLVCSRSYNHSPHNSGYQLLRTQSENAGGPCD